MLRTVTCTGAGRAETLRLMYDRPESARGLMQVSQGQRVAELARYDTNKCTGSINERFILHPDLPSGKSLRNFASILTTFDPTFLPLLQKFPPFLACKGRID